MESRQQGAGCFGCLWLLIGLGLVLSDLGILFPTIPTHRSLGTGERLLLDAIFIVGVPMYISFIGAMVTVKNWGGRIFAGILASLVCAGILFAESAIPSPHTFVASGVTYSGWDLFGLAVFSGVIVTVVFLALAALVATIWTAAES